MTGAFGYVFMRGNSDIKSPLIGGYVTDILRKSFAFLLTMALL